MESEYGNQQLTRDEVDAWRGATLLEFGTDWCGHCQAAQPLLAEALQEVANVRHLKIEDGPGRPLGRSFRVKLWPTFIFLKDGVELERVVRPLAASEIRMGLERITG